MTNDLDWRLTVDGETSGCGFAVTPTMGLTCAHVAGKATGCVVGAHRDDTGRRCAVRAVRAYADRTDLWADLAVIDLAGHPPRAVAPLGSPRRPAVGTVVDLLGLPKRDSRRRDEATRDRSGRRVRARVAGTHAAGRWLQLDALDGHTAWVEAGFSGCAAVDEANGLVVGMVVEADGGRDQRTAWLMPLDIVLAHVPGLPDAPADPVRADPAFARFRASFDAARYQEALDTLYTVHAAHQDASDVYYYWALTLLQGIRPAAHSGQLIDGVERVLGEACRLDATSRHARALLDLVREDYYVQRGLVVAGRTVSPDAAHGVAAPRAAEIIRHVPAPECRTWQAICRQSRNGR